MKILASLFTCLLIVCKMQGQINEREITPVQLSEYIPGFNEVSTINSITVNVVFNVQTNDPSPVDGDSTTEGARALKYADFALTNIGISYGNITSTSLGKVWTLRISVPNAKNVGLDFTQVSLPSNAEMYIYNVSGTRLKGVIKSEFFSTPQTFSISPTKDWGIVIFILERNNFSSFQSSFVVSKVFGGFLSLEYSDGGSAFLNNAMDQNRDFRINDVSGPFATIAENPNINLLIDYNGHCSPYVQCFPDKITTARAVGRITVGGFAGTY